MSEKELLEMENVQTEEVPVENDGADVQSGNAPCENAENISEQQDTEVAVIAAPPKCASEKNYGVELLRILSMFFIIVLHIINFGGISFYSGGVYFPLGPENMAHYKVMNIMLAFCFCAVNCYALISGYVSCKSKFKPSKLISLWLTVVSINAVLYGLAYLYNPEWVAAHDIKNVFMPLSNDQYWYFTAYVGLMIIMPALNAAVNNIPKKTYGYMILGILAFFVLFPSHINRDIFYTHTGYSMLWLVFMYLIGAYFRLHFNPQRKIPLLKTACAVIYIAACVLLAFHRFGMEEKALADTGIYTLYGNDYLYTSPFVVVASIALFVLFINIKIKNRILGTVIGFVSSTTFGIYLIHLNYIVVERILTGHFVDSVVIKFSEYDFMYKNPAFLITGVLCGAVVIFVICACMEKVRQLLFKYLFIDKPVSLVDKIKLPQKKDKIQ